MSELLSFIRAERNRGKNDFSILQSTKKYTRTINSNNMKGAGAGTYTLKNDEPKTVLAALEVLPTKDVADYQKLFSAASAETQQPIDGFDSFEEIQQRLSAMSVEAGSAVSGEPDASAMGMDTAPMDDQPPLSGDEVFMDDSGDVDMGISATGPNMDNTTTVQVTGYETIEPGTELYHPSIDVGKIAASMVLVDTPQVLDHNKQRSFSVFFTPSEEYARRFSGLWSLNKRPVFVHKVRVKENAPITKVRIIDADSIPDNIENLDFAKRLCGDSLDGFVNGIKINQTFVNGQDPIAEYYICNPALFFERVETWMQFRSTQWIKISPENTSSIIVPKNGENGNINAGMSGDDMVMFGSMDSVGPMDDDSGVTPDVVPGDDLVMDDD